MAIKKGIYAASMSIFNQDLSLDIESTIKHSERLINEGLHGAIFFGSTGCAQLISSKAVSYTHLKLPTILLL